MTKDPRDQRLQEALEIITLARECAIRGVKPSADLRSWFDTFVASTLVVPSEPNPIVLAAELREALTRVSSMLDDPHPGLLTWTEALVERLHKLKAVLDRACEGKGVVRL